jgi:hypothetical protein
VPSTACGVDAGHRPYVGNPAGSGGFSSTVEGNAITRDQQIAKLGLIVETAEEVWG